MTAVRLTLSFGQRRFLLMLADRGRHVRMAITEKAIGRKAQVGVLAMAHEFAGLTIDTFQDGRRVVQLAGVVVPVPPVPLIRLTPLVGTSGEFDVWLNDLGTQVVNDMKILFASEVAQARDEGSGGEVL